MIRVAAVGDVHLDEALRGRLRPSLVHLPERADVLLLAGDLTRHGTPGEAKVVADEFATLGLPVIAVLGNHDYHSDLQVDVRAVLESGGIRVLEGEGVVLDLPAGRLGIGGAKGFGLGFAGRQGSDFGEPEMKAFARHGKESARRLYDALEPLDADVLVALMHYSPVEDTLVGEPPQIWPFLGCYLLAEAVDAVGADLAVHGHAHAGTEKGRTPGGVPVRNVAQPVIRAAYQVYELEPRRAAVGGTSEEAELFRAVTAPATTSS